jgi:hypothetical protein
MFIKGEKTAFSVGLHAALAIGIVFAVLLVVVMGLLDLSVKLYIARGFKDDIWELEQTRELELEGSFKKISSACRQALLLVPNVTNVSDDNENHLARALTGASWRSPGEEIEVEINPVDETKWRLRCISRPKSSSVVFDYGKNFENVEIWRKQIATELAESNVK